MLCKVRPLLFGKKRGQAPKRSHGVGVQAPRPTVIGITEDRGRVLVWPMSPYERRGKGNAFLCDGKHHTWMGNTLKGQRGSRHLASTKAAQLWTQSQIKLDNAVMCRADG